MARKAPSRGKQDDVEYIQEILEGTLSIDEKAVAHRLNNL